VRLAMELESDLSLTNSVHVKQPTRSPRSGVEQVQLTLPGIGDINTYRGKRDTKEWVVP
jgi:hypothetical protein